ncbi:MAG: serine hydrolase domain-containing protein [Lewinella sp.]
MFRCVLAGIALVCLAVSCHQPQGVDAYLEDLHERGLLNGNVLIVRHDSILYQRSFGYADPIAQRPLTAGHFFAIGSIQKEFPAAAILRLSEEGAVGLDTPIASYLRDLPAWSERVTARQLLQYSSGLPEVDWNHWFGKTELPDQEAIVDSLRHVDELVFPAGTDYRYTNYSPFLLQRIVEEVTGLPFGVFLEEEFLYPHHIRGITLRDRFPYSDTTAMALPFDEDFNMDDMAYRLTTVCVTSEGLYKWVRELDNFSLLSKASVRTLSEEAGPGDNVQAPLGRGDWSNEELTLHLHHGSSHNFEALVRDHKPEGLIIVLLTNRKNGNLHEIADELRRMVSARHA